MFAALFHADWSTHSGKRWGAFAVRKGIGWSVRGPLLAPKPDTLIDTLFGAAWSGPVLAGFDFPIGVPAAYGLRTGLLNFTEALSEFGTGRFARFYDVAERADEIAIERPFYPRASTAEAKQRYLISADDVQSIDDLRRSCEKATGSRRAACPLFWTLGQPSWQGGDCRLA